MAGGLSAQRIHDSDFDRMIKTLRFERTDRVPVWEPTIESRSVNYLLGKECRSSLLSPGESVMLARRLGMDVIRAYAPRGLGETHIIAGDGSYDYVGGTIKSRSDLTRFDFSKTYQEWLADTRRSIKAALDAIRGTSLGVTVMIEGPLQATYCAMGHEDFFYAVHDDPELVLTLMDTVTEYSCEVARLLVCEGVPLAFIADDIAHTSGLLLNPTMLGEWWFPRVLSIADILKSGHIPFIFHCCGILDHVLPMLVKLGAAGIHPVQANCNDIYQVRKQYGRQIALFGNIDLTFPLSTGTPEDVRRDVLEHLGALGPLGGYVVGSSHSILNSVPPQNFLTMVETAKEWRPPGV